MIEKNRGDIWYVNLGEGEGSEQEGIKPFLIIQNDIGNKHSTVTIGFPITSKSKSYTRTHVYVEGFGLTKPSYILCEQIRAIDELRFERKLGQLDAKTMTEVEMAIKIQLGL